MADRFGTAPPLLDDYHTRQHLGAGATAVHGEGTTAVRRWVEPLLEQVRYGQAAKVIWGLEQLELRVAPAAAEMVARKRQYFENHRGRWDYATAEKNGWRLGATGRWNRVVGNTHVGSSGRDNFGV